MKNIPIILLEKKTINGLIELFYWIGKTKLGCFNKVYKLTRNGKD